jgi:hypothetical protein
VARSSTTKAKREQAELKEKTDRFKRNRRLLGQVHADALKFTQGLRRNMDPTEAIQLVLDNLAAMYSHATMQVLTLSEDEYWRETMSGPIPHEWIREQERLGMQIVHTAGKASQMGLAERMVRIEEQQAAIFQVVIEQALIKIGIEADDRRRVHTMIAEGLEDIEGTAEQIPA